MAHVTTPQETRTMVAARTIHPPHCKRGTKRRISTRKASRETRTVGRRRMSKARRYRGEWDGERKWAAAAMIKQTKVRNAATGCTIRMEERELRAVVVKLRSGSLVSRIPSRHPEVSLVSHSSRVGEKGISHWYCIPPADCYIGTACSSQRRQSRHFERSPAGFP